MTLITLKTLSYFDLEPLNNSIHPPVTDYYSKTIEAKIIIPLQASVVVGFATLVFVIIIFNYLRIICVHSSLVSIYIKDNKKKETMLTKQRLMMLPMCVHPVWLPLKLKNCHQLSKYHIKYVTSKIKVRYQYVINFVLESSCHKRC
jgi:hypothetical protein